VLSHLIAKRGEPRPSDIPIIVESIDEVSAPDGISTVAQAEGQDNPLPGWFLGLLPYTGLALLALLGVGLALVAQGSTMAALGRQDRQVYSRYAPHELTPTR
jgi:hypothetical protein